MIAITPTSSVVVNTGACRRSPASMAVINQVQAHDRSTSTPALAFTTCRR
jgi:hypothetical protein